MNDPRILNGPMTSAQLRDIEAIAHMASLTHSSFVCPLITEIRRLRSGLATLADTALCICPDGHGEDPDCVRHQAIALLGDNVR